MRVFVPNHYSFKNKNKPDSSSQSSNQQKSSSSCASSIPAESENCDSKVTTEEVHENNFNLTEQQHQQSGGGDPTSGSANEEAKDFVNQRKYISGTKSSNSQELISNLPSAASTGTFLFPSLPKVKDSGKRNPLLSPVSKSRSFSAADSGIQPSPKPIRRQFKRRASPSSSSIPHLPASSCDELNLSPSLKKHKSDPRGNQNHFQGSKQLLQHTVRTTPIDSTTICTQRSLQSTTKCENTDQIARAMGLGRNAHDPVDHDKYGHTNHRNTHGEGNGHRKQTIDIQLHSSHHDQTHDANTNRNTANSSSESREMSNICSFQEALKKRGLEEIEQEGDGNCLFRAVSLQIYGDSDSHMDVRKRCMDFMGKDVAHFSQFVVDEPFQEYIMRKRQDGVHGNNPEIQAISELYNRPVEVFVPENGASPINIFQSEYKTGDAPIRLSYHDGNHYNAVVDPLLPTAGLGLGLPGLEPGLADKLQMQKAVDESDKIFIQKVTEDANDMELKSAIEESKKLSGKDSSVNFDYIYAKKKAVAFSDMEKTNYEMEQAMLLSSLESFQRSEASRKQSGIGRGRGRQRCDDIGSCSSRTFDNRSYLSSEPSTDVASLSAVASSSSAAFANQNEDEIPAHLMRQDSDEYPQTIQELVMNGFELPRVLKAYDLIGDNFDDLLAFLMSSGN